MVQRAFKPYTVIFPLLALALAAVAGGRPGIGQEPDKSPSRADFMRKKLEYSKNVLDGLAREDFAMIEKNAKALNAMSRAAEWEVPMIPDVEHYVPYTAEFQRLASELTHKAREKNLDGATLAYVGLTMNCVNCHKYVRTVKR